MDLRGRVRAQVGTRFTPTTLGLILGLVGAGLLMFGRDRYQRLAAVGVLYVLIGIATVLIEVNGPTEFDIRSLWYLLLGLLGLLFVYVIGDLLWARAQYEPIGPELLTGSLRVGIDRYLMIAPVGFFVLLGFAVGSSERLYATPPIVVILSLVTILELLSGYQGFGWPALQLLLIAVWLALVVVFGVPLYVLGVSWRAARDPRP